MTVEITNYPEVKLTLVEYSGRVTLSERLRSNRRFAHNGQNTAGYNFLVDFRDASSFEADFGKIISYYRQLAPIFARRNPQSQTAFFAPTDMSYGIGRMFQTVSNTEIQHEIGVFRDPLECIRHLNRRPSSVANHVGERFFRRND